MELSNISKFFTTRTLDEIIQNAGGTKHTSVQFRDESSKKGSSYPSDVFRFKVFGTNQNGEPMDINVIVKAMPKNATRRITFRCSDFFRNEINFYKTVIPKFEEFQKKRAPPKPFVSYPKCLACYCDGENDFIAMEDISFFGYQDPVRQDYTDIETCSLIMKTLGRFHAVSLAYNDQEDIKPLLENIEELYYKESLRSWYSPFLKLATEIANDAVSKTYPGTDYEMKTKKFLGEGLYDDMINMVSKKTKYSVIGHGDCWRPNFLTKFKESTMSPESVKIIDFQLVRYASPVFDIIFFLYNSTSEEQRKEHFNKLIKSYHQSAFELIRDLGSDPEKVFPFSALENELQEFARLGCGFCIESLPLSMLEDDEITDLNSVQCNNATLLDFWKVKCLQNEDDRARLANIFKHSIDNGYIK